MRNASVLPEPVRAAPKTSLPARSSGIDFACTGVIVVRPISARPCAVCGERSSVEKGRRSEGGGEGTVDGGFGGDEVSFELVLASASTSASASASIGTAVVVID